MEGGDWGAAFEARVLARARAVSGHVVSAPRTAWRAGCDGALSLSRVQAACQAGLVELIR